MFINVIKFDITDFKACTSESFVVENTIANQEMILTHRYTRHIVFDRMFDFQFENEMRMPIEFVTDETWMLLVSSDPELFAAVADSEV
jgi:hypothetical protein